MEINTILYIAAAILIVYGYMKYSNKKKDVGQFSMAIGAALAVVVYLGVAGTFLPLAVDNGVAPIVTPIEDADICAVTGPLPIAQLNFTGDTWRQSGANSPTGPAGDVQFYLDGTDVDIPGVTALDTIAVTAGKGSTTNLILKSCTDYEIYYDGGATVEYDQKHPTGRLTAVKTDTGQIPYQTINFHDVKVVATIGDIIEENDETLGTINGQSNVSGVDATGNEIQVGTDVSPADGDTIYYNKTVGDTEFYLDIDMEATGGDKVLQSPALCFVNLANPMEGDEFSLVTLTYRSGTNFGTPVTITDYVSNQKCIPLGDEMKSGESGTYRLAFTVVEANFAPTTDVMYVYLDDLGEYLGEDLLGGTKATAAGFVLQAE